MRWWRRLAAVMVFGLVLYLIGGTEVFVAPVKEWTEVTAWVLRSPTPIACVGPYGSGCRRYQGMWPAHNSGITWLTPAIPPAEPFQVIWRRIYQCRRGHDVVRRRPVFSRLTQLECPGLRQGFPYAPKDSVTAGITRGVSSVARVGETWQWVPLQPLTWSFIEDQPFVGFKNQRNILPGSPVVDRTQGTFWGAVVPDSAHQMLWLLPVKDPES